ncbi:MAG: hypothetical protein GY820_17705 [Gammaproteobacteria bacterium]|nr:hypothetical protein [Gammaproteobacteria bacterium]
MSVSLTSTYAGEFSGKYIAAALLSASTLDSGAISILPNVKFKSVIQKGATDDIVKDASCDFVTNQGTLTLTEAVLQPEEFQVNLQLCKKDLHNSWEAAQMGYSAFDNLAPSFAEFVISHVAAKVADKTEKNIWSGATANSGEFDGFTAKLTADSDVIDVAGTSITSANVITELGKVVDAIPTAVYGQEDLTLYVSSNVARAYIRALGGFAATIGANGSDNKGTQWYNGGELSFDGINIFVAKGLADNTMVAAQKSNLYFGTGILNDQNEVKVIDMSDIDGSQNVRIIMRFTAGVQHVFGGDIVLYS